ncbi:hypothetical protein AGMMS49938_02060 [Fibrobacterales bacterium]|nr:hypothetical protein AGMMS49938_02060 [Fibrobacterales bacterium]
MKIYLDNCCYNRPYDDQSQILVRLESEAKLQIQQLVFEGQLDLIWSFILQHENDANPFIKRKKRIATWEHIAKYSVIFSDEIQRMADDIALLNIKPKDAWHVACAISENADYLITTDKKLLNKPVKGIEIVNPIVFLERYYDEK